MGGRFGLNPQTIHLMRREDDMLRVDVKSPVKSEKVDGVVHWSLKVGCVYSIVQKSKGKRCVKVCDLTYVSSPTEEHSNVRTTDRDVEDHLPPIYQISASNILWKVKGTSKISKFMRQFLDSGRCVQYVDCLMQKYNGDTIFELLPVTSLPKRGAGMKYMDRDNDCYWRTCLMSTSANIYPKDLYQFGKARCSGSITCLNDSCGAYMTGQKRNETSWTGKWRGDHVLKIGETLSPAR